MGTETCFIITQCNFKPEIIAEIKEVLLQKDYASIIAEEIPAYNVDLLDYKILRPMQDSSLVLVLLSPRGEDRKDANFNVAFEFGYARGIKKDVILLFDGDLENLPSDISRDYAISVERENWKEELNRLLTKVNEEKQQGRLVPLPEDIVILLEKGISDNQFDTFANLLLNFSTFFRVSDNQRIVRIIKNIFEEPRFTIHEGDSIKALLYALNNIFFYDRGNDSKALKEFLMKFYFPSILDKSNDHEIIKQIMVLLSKTEENCDSSISTLSNFILSNNDIVIKQILESHYWDFDSNSTLEFCIKFARKLILIKNNRDSHKISDSKIKIIDKMLRELTSAIRQKYKES